MRLTNKLVPLCMASAALFSAHVAAEEKTVVEVMVSPYNVTMNEGDARTMSAHVVYSDGSYDSTHISNGDLEVSWRSSNEDVTPISSNGTIFAKSTGVAHIYASVEGFESPAPATVSIDGASVEDLSLSMRTTNLQLGGEEPIEATALLSNGEEQVVTGEVDWSVTTSNNSFKVEDGKVIALNEGYGYIVGRYQDSRSVPLQVQVSSADYLDVIVTPSSTTMAPDSLFTPSIVAFDSDLNQVTIDPADVSYRISDRSVVLPIANGVLKAVGPGVAEVYVTAEFTESSNPLIITVE